MKTKIFVLLFSSMALSAGAWHMTPEGNLVEDFENAEDNLDEGIHKYSVLGDNQITASDAPKPSVEVKEDEDGNHYLYVQHGNTGDLSKKGQTQLAVVNVTLPDGKTLDDYSTVRVNIKDLTGGSWLYKSLFIVCANKAEVERFQGSSEINQMNSLTENSHEFPIKDGKYNQWNEVKTLNTKQISGDVALGFRMNNNSVNAKYGIDNVTLVAKVPQQTGVAEVNADAAGEIEICEGGVICEKPARVYSVFGQLVAEGTGRICLDGGIYVVVSDGAAEKCVIR